MEAGRFRWAEGAEAEVPRKVISNKRLGILSKLWPVLYPKLIEILKFQAIIALEPDVVEETWNY
jgi:hypothetical protein